MSEQNTCVIDRIKASADKGDADSQLILAVMYDRIVEYRNKEEAFKYYKIAADNGYAPAQYKIALIYENGMRKYDPKTGKTSIIIAESKETAFKYYKLAARNGVTEALMRVLEICKDTNKPKVFEEYYILASNNENEDTRIYAKNLSYQFKRQKRK